jgi:carboxymethylenebutenolidase
MFINNSGDLMGEHVKLQASDGHELDAYVARPAGEPIAGLVVIQEAFGVNSHIRSVTDGWAKDGFLAVAPALFDRVERGVDLTYSADDMQKGIALIRRGDTADRLKDIAAALDYARRESGKKAGIIGYCLGGSVAWLAATRLDPAVAVGYYGGQIVNFAGEKPKAPIMLHFGMEDHHIPRKRSMRRFTPRIPRFPSSGTRARATASTATTAPPTTPRPRSWRASDRWSS